MDAVGLVLLAAAVLLGSATTRLTGMGLALVASPLLVLLLGPANGVSLLLVLGLAGAPLMVAQLWRSVEPKKALGLFVPACIGLLPGTWITRTLPGPVLAIVVGVLVVVSVGVTVASERARVFKGTPGLLASGFLSGFMNAIAGIGGPPVVLYALSTEWAHASFVATIQLYFFGLSAATLVARGLPHLDASEWITAVGALVAGLGLGHVVAGHVSAKAARALVIAVALAGGVATIVKGVTALG